jgi:hypothetical protein
MKLVRAIVIALAATTFLFAQEATTTTTTTTPAAPVAKTAKAAKTMKKEAAKIVTGTLISVDAVANTIVVKVKKAEDTISVDAAAKIMSGKKAVALADLKVNSKVSVTWKMVDGKKVASKIKEVAVTVVKKAKKVVKEVKTTDTTTTTTK